MLQGKGREVVIFTRREHITTSSDYRYIFNSLTEDPKKTLLMMVTATKNKDFLKISFSFHTTFNHHNLKISI